MPELFTGSRAARFAAAYALLRAAADVADHWIQSDHQARVKGQHDHTDGQSSAAGRRACAAHVATYTATQGAALLLGSRALGVRLRPGPVVAALALSAVTHYVADRREPLRRLADATGKGEFVRLADHGMNGAYALDQAWHHAFETAAAVIAST
ncbi:hypothetical protein GCM10010495_11510 [Kitasatospora herbaricolor]|uniref:hypothetical protein n=1 Tax=Kitasatospora herbaricolor TaxID=68217 RepID=UPI00174A57A0|nr:hypothetical protein [Kitasatospora herbaricolor]MDQ0309412.1 hypothetical protein [Kitasatospora herbaricolor]GGV01974.1 hypothetical protein GCM10010495_11510 [Kitasatospora herbaricolor]